VCEHAQLHRIGDNCKGRACVSELAGKPRHVFCAVQKDEKLKVGDRVIFYENKHNYSIGRSNPVYGSKHFCIGTITETGGGITGSWDNGSGNGYEPDDLILESKFADMIKNQKVNPNLSFKYGRKRI
jgi:hypothetical protein